MVRLRIDNLSVQVPEGTTILAAAQSAGVHIPHLCYLKGINEIAACRVCCVEVEGERAMVTACNSPVKEGMVVHTNSPRARQTRRTNVELILSQHDCRCAACARSGNCQLQTIANDLGILTVPYKTQLPEGLRGAWTTTFPLYHDYNKCIKCMRCIQICDKVQSLSIWDVAGTGGRTVVDVSNNRVIKDSDCALTRLPWSRWPPPSAPPGASTSGSAGRRPPWSAWPPACAAWVSAMSSIPISPPT